MGFYLAEQGRKDGVTFPVEVHVGSVHYGGKRMMLAACRDVTGLKRAAEILKESEERFRSAFENSSTGVALGDAPAPRRSVSTSLPDNSNNWISSTLSPGCSVSPI